MEKIGEKMIIIEYEKKIEYLEKKVSDLEMINLKLGETLSNVTFEMESLVTKKEQEIWVLKEKLEQSLAKIPKIELNPAEPNLAKPNPAEPSPAEPNPVFDDFPLDEILFDPSKCTTIKTESDNELVAVPIAPVDSPQNYLEIFESRKIEIQRDANGYQCDQCDYKSLLTRNFHQHYRIHTGDEPFGCMLCKQRFKSRSSCIRHIRGHDDRFKLKCSLCDYTATRTEYIVFHAKKAHNGNQTCKNKVLKNESSPKSSPKPCPDVDLIVKTCKTKSNLFNLFKPIQTYPNLLKRTHDQLE